MPSFQLTVAVRDRLSNFAKYDSLSSAPVTGLG
jgi:hypothetical protein